MVFEEIQPSSWTIVDYVVQCKIIFKFIIINLKIIILGIKRMLTIMFAYW